ncbi:MAG: ABC transporter ATP-binding protein [Thermoanaerobaculia bacterium]
MSGSDVLIEVSALTRRFGAKTALDSVDVSVRRGAVYGLVGANGAGKTTLIRHILGLLRAESGTVRVFGLDPVSDPVGVLSRIGYLAEENDLPPWMRVDELFRYSRAFYPNWDVQYEAELQSVFGLDATGRLRNLSKGQKARAGLVTALAHRPPLVLLDEPSSGLDPIVRRDILGAVFRTMADEGRTVFFSSHLLDEVERVADHVTMMSNGRVVMSASLRSMIERHRRLTVRFAGSPGGPPDDSGALRWEARGDLWEAIVDGDSARLRERLASQRAEVVSDRAATLDEIFVGHVGSRADTAGEG